MCVIIASGIEVFKVFKGINLKEATELALIHSFCNMGITSISEKCINEYLDEINSNLEKEYGNLWYETNSYPDDEIIFKHEYRKNGYGIYRLKEKYILNYNLLKHIIMNYPFQVIKESETEFALNKIGLSKDEDNNIKRLVLKK